jgi:hypothetical protein
MSGFSDEEITELATVFAPGARARALLAESGFPAAHIPSPDSTTGHLFWSQISEAIEYGIIEDGRMRILKTASRRYEYNPVFKRGAESAAGGESRPLRVRVIGAGLGNSYAVAENGSPHLIRADQESRLLLKVQELGHLEVELSPAATVDDLRFSRERPPDILHLICHGGGGRLVFADEFGDPHRVPATDVAELIAAYGIRFRGIVLNACNGAECADAFRPLADTVIAHRGAVDDDCARLYADQLYRALYDVPDLASAARIAAQHLATGPAQRPEISAGLVVLTADGGH